MYQQENSHDLLHFQTSKDHGLCLVKGLSIYEKRSDSVSNQINSVRTVCRFNVSSFDQIPTDDFVKSFNGNQTVTALILRAKKIKGRTD